MKSASLARVHRILAAGFIVCVLSNCALQKNMTSAEPTAFQKSTGTPASGKIARLPFSHSWRDPQLDPTKYSHMLIRPVSLDYLRKDQWHESASAQLTSQKQYLGYVREVARHWDKSLQTAFRGKENHLELTSDTALPGTLILEIALTEVVFGHPETYVASWAVPGGGVADSLMFSPSVAFEARVRDAATGKIVATAGDRRGTRLKIVDMNRLSITKPNLEVCDEWAQQIMQSFNKRLFPSVERSWFSLY